MPAGILATLIIVFPTADFREFLGMQKDFLQAFFSLAAIATTVWLILAPVKIRKSLTIDEIVDRLRTSSLPPETHQHGK